jgi:leader peptidase (prepilin peptidase)/N-methyltransferase
MTEFWHAGLALLLGGLVGQLMNSVVESLPRALERQGETTEPSIFSTSTLRRRFHLTPWLGAGLTWLVVLRFGFHAPTLWALIFTWGLLALSFIDLEAHLLPDALTLPLLWGGLLMNALGMGFALPADAIWGAALGYGFLWTVDTLYQKWAGRPGLGGGDFKMMGALGATLGWQVLPMVVLMASLLGILAALPMLLKTRNISLGQALPFGPFLALAGIGGILFR